MLLVIGLLTFNFSCGGNSCDDVAAKIAANKELSSSDYDVIIDYLDQSIGESLPKLREARTYGDLDRIETEMEEKYPHSNPFYNAILHDWNKLSESQRNKFKQLKDKAKENTNE
ncbi:MAG: hypothetical protein NC189_00575 [Bacteroides sp.]|nr:hypothetical protein [Bacteroides sp.]MCM1476884.1 hypothetical protein [Bacteroides sp.]